MFKRQTSGSVVCSNCGRLVGVNDERCFNCGKWNPGLWGFGPAINRLVRDLGFMEVVLGVCIVFFLLSYLYGGRPPQGIMSILSPDMSSLYKFGSSGAFPVFIGGRWWTVLSAAWLHGGILHIFMNMMALRQLMPAVAEFFGTSRLVIIYTFSAAAGFFVTSAVGYFGLFVPGLPGFLRGAPFTVGASAPLLGLCGALVLYGHRTGSRMLTQQIVRWVIILVVIGLFVPVMDNWAHIGGFAGGYAVARILDPMREEKPGHAVAALVCLVLNAGALALSFLLGPSWEELMTGLGR